MTHLVIGFGEVGKAIHKVFNATIHDPIQGFEASCTDPSQPKTAHDYDFMHICIPYTSEFINAVEEYQDAFNPKFTIIHSTVPVGTSRTLGALHSPIRGLHPHLYEGVMTFPKFIGGEDASLVADEFRRAGLKIIIVDKQETTELGKLLDTEYYRDCIEFTLKAKNLCTEHMVPFHEVYTLFNQTYNEGYAKLGHSEYVRPVLQPIMKEIGGHCVLPNKKLLDGIDF